MSLPHFFISCDWGTSNFRLKLVRTEDLSVYKESSTSDGVKVLFERFKASGEIDQKQFFSNFLVDQVNVLPNADQAGFVICSGMSSSTIGLHELPYATMPFDASGRDLNRERFSLNENFEVLLISGVKDQVNVMRGEEIQAIGMEDELRSYGDGVLILPGTHSKHLNYQSRSFTGMKNYMTGELFGLLASKSILSNSVEEHQWDAKYRPAFETGLELGSSGHFSSGLLSVRGKGLLEETDSGENYYYLSGLLIGEELRYLKFRDLPVFLAAQGTIHCLYRIALEVILNHTEAVVFEPEIFERSIVIGQKKILLLDAK